MLYTIIFCIGRIKSKSFWEDPRRNRAFKPCENLCPPRKDSALRQNLRKERDF
ncbi:hypothetical protein [uncultured Helicobacter sp.]|uniref:hypothetical protein n=1 Tax=uncultured Helicobacter sp. TaxID=175537 RepID=UPI0025FD4522|nr:hypothetical protein [uncultured Helicobacter sp.]